MCRQVDMKGIAQGCRLQETADATASGGISLQHVDRATLE